MAKTSSVLVVDCDEVLVKINQKWYNDFIANPRIKEFLLDTQIDPSQIHWNVNTRKNYFLLNHLNFQSPSDLPEEIDKIFMDTYFGNPTFYDDLPISNYFQALFNIFETHSHFIKELHVVTHTMDNSTPVLKSKNKFLLAYLKTINKKIPVKLHFLEKHEKKSECINNEIGYYDSFVDDALHNIEDVIENTDSYNKEFLIPLYTYNSVFVDKANHEKDRNIAISYFNNG